MKKNVLKALFMAALAFVSTGNVFGEKGLKRPKECVGMPPAKKEKGKETMKMSQINADLEKALEAAKRGDKNAAMWLEVTLQAKFRIEETKAEIKYLNNEIAERDASGEVRKIIESLDNLESIDLKAVRECLMCTKLYCKELNLWGRVFGNRLKAIESWLTETKCILLSNVERLNASFPGWYEYILSRLEECERKVMSIKAKIMSEGIAIVEAIENLISRRDDLVKYVRFLEEDLFEDLDSSE